MSASEPEPNPPQTSKPPSIASRALAVLRLLLVLAAGGAVMAWIFSVVDSSKARSFLCTPVAALSIGLGMLWAFGTRKSGGGDDP